MLHSRRQFTLGLGALALPGVTLASTQQAAWPFLKPGDTIDVIAPSSPVDLPHERYEIIRAYFKNTPYNVNIPEDLIEPTSPLDEANTIEKRVAFIHAAFNSSSKAVWAIGGGGWGTRLLGELAKLPRPQVVKPLLGYSDVTALHVFCNQHWGMPSIQSVVLGINGDISPGWNKTGLSEAMDVLTGKTPTVTYPLTAVNPPAAELTHTVSRIVGGNSLLVSALNGTSQFTLDTRGKFLFLESVADNPGQFSRKLMGMTLSPLVQQCAGVIFGDVIQTGGRPNSPETQAQIDAIIGQFGSRFAPTKPVMLAKNLFGHGEVNLPLPLNTVATFTNLSGGRLTVAVSANMMP